MKAELVVGQNNEQVTMPSSSSIPHTQLNIAHSQLPGIVGICLAASVQPQCTLLMQLAGDTMTNLMRVSSMRDDSDDGRTPHVRRH